MSNTGAGQEPKVAVAVEILDKQYQVSCPESEREGLESAARMLDGRMREIRQGSKIVGLERLAVISALNLVHELNQGLEKARSSSANDNTRLRTLLERLDDKVGASVADAS